MADYRYERLTALDNSFLVFESAETPMHVGWVAILDAGPLLTAEGGVDIGRIGAHIASVLHRIPRYRERLAYIPIEGHPVWVDDHQFNLNYHLRHASLPRPGDERQLKRLSARIMSQQLDRGKPLWEMWVVEGLKGDRLALIWKIHHCMIDGIAGVDLLSVLLNFSPEYVTPPDPPRWIPRPAPSRTALLRDEVIARVTARLGFASRFVRQPIRMVSEVWAGVEALAETLGAGLHLASDTPLNQPIGPHRRFDWTAMELSALQEVKNRLGGTVNDVVLATVAGAVRRFFQRRGLNLDGLEFRVFVPVNMRSAAERGTLGNRVAAWFVDLPITERDPSRRFRKVRDATAHLKESNQARGAEILTEVADWTGSTLLTFGTRLASQARPFNLVVTNVPGPPRPVYLLGARVEEAYPMVPLFVNQGLGVALFRIAGKIFWGFNADWDVVPDLHDFVAAIEASFAELHNQAGRPIEIGRAKAKGKGNPGARPRTRGALAAR